jgi:hypothetical protein
MGYKDYPHKGCIRLHNGDCVTPGSWYFAHPCGFMCRYQAWLIAALVVLFLLFTGWGVWV